VATEELPLDSARCPLSESSGAERHLKSNVTQKHRTLFFVLSFANREYEKRIVSPIFIGPFLHLN
jgi:hypothetical protein